MKSNYIYYKTMNSILKLQTKFIVIETKCDKRALNTALNN